jgi:UTP-glucose-1-phosphate uridylyltransferase
VKTIGLLPASGKASRMNGLPKFALPCDEDNTSLIERQVQQMSFYVDRIVISTTSKWYELIKSFDLNKVDIVVIEPSTMNDALVKMSEQYKADNYIVGMPDTYFKGENPYIKLSNSIKNNMISIACWSMHDELKGKVGQVELVKNSIIDIKEKIEDCNYSHMWGAFALNNTILNNLNRFNMHIGVDLEYLIVEQINNMYAFEVDGRYFDAGTIDGYRDLLNNI